MRTRQHRCKKKPDSMVMELRPGGWILRGKTFPSQHHYYYYPSSYEIAYCPYCGKHL